MLKFTVRFPLQSYINGSLASAIVLMEENTLYRNKSSSQLAVSVEDVLWAMF